MTYPERVTRLKVSSTIVRTSVSAKTFTVNDWIAGRGDAHTTYEDLWSVARATLDRETCSLWNQPLNQTEIALLDLALQRFVAGEPLSRIRGWVTFCGHRFRVTPAVLDPRPESEMIVSIANHLKFASVLELGVGSGCIICSILLNHPVRALAVDKSAAALKVAQFNATQLSVTCEFKLSDWCANVDGQFDLVVANPPYVATNAPLSKDVWAYDPQHALDGGLDGCEAHRIALPQAKGVLAPGGTVLWEIGYDQRRWITEYAKSIFPNATISILNDYNKLPRLLVVKTY